MKGRNYYKENPFSPEMIAESNRQCCVSADRERKKRWTDKAEAAAVALITNGKHYPCIFHKGTYHVTTTTRHPPIKAGDAPLKGDPNAKIKRLCKKMEETRKELESIREKVKSCNFEELKQVSIQLIESRLHKENTIRQICAELKTLKTMVR